MERRNANRIKTPTTPSPAQQVRHKPSVLVVDDDHLVRIMVQLALERHGFQVLPASSGREAIDQYRTHQQDIDVVLLDVRMPGLDGPRTLDHLHELNPHIPVCFMSGDLGIYEPDELVRRGAAYVIHKPFLLDDLATILRLLAQGVPVELLPCG